MASGAKRFLQLVFGIGGNLDSSFKDATGKAKKDLTDLEKKAREDAVKEKARMRELRKQWKEGGEHFDKFKDHMGSAWETITKTAKWAAATSAATTVALYGLAKQTAELGEDAMAMHSKFGVNIKDYTAMAHAATMAGVPMDSYTQSYKFLTKTMTAALAGNKQAELAFRRANVTLRDSHGHVKNINQIMLEASDTFKKMPDGIYKGSLAMALFGKNGQEMTMLMEEGSKEIKKATEQAEQLGLVFDEDAGKKSLEFNASMRLLTGLSKGLMYTLGKELMPVLTGINTQIFNWSMANQGLIKTKIHEWVQQFSERLPGIIQGVKDFIGTIKDIAGTVNTVVQGMGGWSKVIKTLVYGLLIFKSLQMSYFFLQAGASLIKMFVALSMVAKGIGLFGGMISIIKGIGIAFMWLGRIFMMNPIGLALTVVIGLIVLLWWKWDYVVKYFHVTVDFLSKWFNIAWEKISTGFHATVNFLSAIWNSCVSFFNDKVQAVSNFFSSTWEKITGFFNTIVEAHKLGWEIVTNFIGDKLNTVSDFFHSIWSGITSFFTGIIDYIRDAFKDGFILGIIRLWYALNPVNIIVNSILGIWKTILGEDNYNKGVQFINQWLDGVLDWLKNKGKQIAKAAWDVLPTWAQKVVGIQAEMTVKGAQAGMDAVRSVGNYLGFGGPKEAQQGQVAPAPMVAPVVVQTVRQAQDGVSPSAAPAIQAVRQAQAGPSPLAPAVVQAVRQAHVGQVPTAPAVVQAVRQAQEGVSPAAEPVVQAVRQAQVGPSPAAPAIVQAVRQAKVGPSPGAPEVVQAVRQMQGAPATSGAPSSSRETKPESLTALSSARAKGATSSTATFNFAPVVNISSGTDPSVVRKAIDDALKAAQDKFNQWAANAQAQQARTAMR